MARFVLIGLLVFTFGLGAVVFPRPIADAVGEATGRPVGHRAVVAIRGIGFAAAIGGFALLLS